MYKYKPFNSVVDDGIVDYVLLNETDTRYYYVQTNLSIVQFPNSLGLWKHIYLNSLGDDLVKA